MVIYFLRGSLSFTSCPALLAALLPVPLSVPGALPERPPLFIRNPLLPNAPGLCAAASFGDAPAFLLDCLEAVSYTHLTLPTIDSV